MSDKYNDQPVAVFKRFILCPVCGDGHVEFTGEIMPSLPPRYTHQCIQCSLYFLSNAVTGQIMYKYIAESTPERSEDAAKDAPKDEDKLTIAYMTGEIEELRRDLELTRIERNRARLEEEKKWRAVLNKRDEAKL